MPMCLPCVEAGRWNKSGHYETAAEIHSKCFYPESCTCQHKVGEGNVDESVQETTTQPEQSDGVSIEVSS